MLAAGFHADASRRPNLLVWADLLPGRCYQLLRNASLARHDQAA